MASSALFDLSDSHKIFTTEGEGEYRKYQRENKKNILKKGVAYPFISRFLNINLAYPESLPVEVVLLSRNDPDTGQRVFNSIQHYELDITRAAFLNGKSPHKYIPSFNVSLFLSANENDVKSAINEGFPAGTVMPSTFEDNEDDPELRVAFDFDGVIADDEAEAVYEKNENLNEFCDHEKSKVDIPHGPGPLADLFKKLSFLQKMEKKREREEEGYKRILQTSIITARNAPTNERVVTTLNDWGVSPDGAFFLGGMEKYHILEVIKPHMFFDDQIGHLTSVDGKIPSVHIPFGIRNIK